MKYNLIIISILLLGRQGFAQQTKILVRGRIEFEKVVNMYAIFKKSGQEQKSIEAYQAENKQFFVLKSTLLFDNNKTLFKPEKSEQQDKMINSVTPFPFAIQRNIIYTDFASQTLYYEKKLVEETEFLKDSVNAIKWKLTEEFRDIAGFSCRRANAIMYDSIYVVAFYTNAIHISGGPESFSGLPGMILQVALPHENVIWRAVKVMDEPITVEKITHPQKGQVITKRQFAEKIKDVMKDLQPRLRALLIKDFVI